MGTAILCERGRFSFLIYYKNSFTASYNPGSTESFHGAACLLGVTSLNAKWSPMTHLLG